MTKLHDILAHVDREPRTGPWYGLRYTTRTFGIFEAFPDERARDRHLAGRGAMALVKEFDHDLWLRSTEPHQRHSAAMNLVEVGALRLTAARIVGQPVQTSRALSTLQDGLHALGTLRREADARYAEEERAAAQAVAVRRPTASSSRKAGSAPTRRKRPGPGEPAA